MSKDELTESILEALEEIKKTKSMVESVVEQNKTLESRIEKLESSIQDIKQRFVDHVKHYEELRDIIERITEVLAIFPEREYRFCAVGDVDIAGKTLLLRADLDVPLNGLPLEKHPKIIKFVDTIEDIIRKGANVVVMAHQGIAPGKVPMTTSRCYDFREHIKAIKRILGNRGITNIVIKNLGGSVIDEEVRKKIKDSISSAKEEKQVRVLFLGNLTESCVDEYRLAERYKPGEAEFVKSYSELLDGYVLDNLEISIKDVPSCIDMIKAFREQQKPCFIGKSLNEEIVALIKFRREVPLKEGRILILGGARVYEAIRHVRYLLEKRIIDKVLTGGYIGLAIAGHEKDIDALDRDALRGIFEDEGTNFDDGMKSIKSLIHKWQGSILWPKDVAVRGEKGNRKIEGYPPSDKVLDIGDYTIELYKKVLKEAIYVVFCGVLGKYEEPEFRKGTEELLRCIIRNENIKKAIFAGKHLTFVINLLPDIADAVLKDKNKYTIIRNGFAALHILADEPAPGLDALSREAWT